MQPPWFHHFASRAQKGIALWLVAEHRLWVNPVATPTARATGQQIGHVRAELSLLTGDVILDRLSVKMFSPEIEAKAEA